MLPKEFQLTPFEFYQSRRKMSRLSSTFASFSVKPTDNPFPRFTITTPVSLDKRSTRRHQTKRIIIEAVRKYLPKFKKNVDVLIKPSKILTKQDRLLVEKGIENFFMEIGLL